MTIEVGQTKNWKLEKTKIFHAIPRSRDSAFGSPAATPGPHTRCNIRTIPCGHQTTRLWIGGCHARSLAFCLGTSRDQTRDIKHVETVPLLDLETTRCARPEKERFGAPHSSMGPLRVG